MIKNIDRTEVLNFQKRVGIVQGLETTRASAVDADYFLDNIEAGVMAINITIGAPEARKGETPESWSLMGTLRSIDEWHKVCASVNNSDRILVPVQSVEDILDAKKNGKVGIIFGLQGGGYWFDRDLILARSAHRFGIRIVGMAYQRRSIFTDGACEATNCGLSLNGRELVKELNKIGMVIDLSHCGEQSSLEVMELSDHPVIFSHSGVRALSPVAENITDKQLDYLKKNGGVLGIPSFSPDLMRDPGNSIRPTIEDFVDHVDYVVQRIGVNHVGYGLDYAYRRVQDDLETHNSKYSDALPELLVKTVQIEGLEWATDIVNVTQLLFKRGYKENDIEKILSKNFLRIFKQVWGK